MVYYDLKGWIALDCDEIVYDHIKLDKNTIISEGEIGKGGCIYLGEHYKEFKLPIEQITQLLDYKVNFTNPDRRLLIGQVCQAIILTYMDAASRFFKSSTDWFSNLVLVGFDFDPETYKIKPCVKEWTIFNVSYPKKT